MLLKKKKFTLNPNHNIPAKISTICYVHDFTERTVKEITAVARLDDYDLMKLRI